ncbi:beta-glucosidase [Micromonospora kangleipakensis]|uniref:Exo-alpha-(1->6)-L-arabinopyranosidase n=1 Tax=Micromonospora kangleipakensis TaxID=1077942 RepID=A0A4Q8BHF7_9ACTN|nr:beta-glucosidase [Micromonospora kangleipakensis]
MKPTHRAARSPGRFRRSLVPTMITAVLALGLAAPANAQESYPFQNPDLSLSKRVDDLLGRLTLDEKISLLHQYQPAIPRLGIKAFKTGTEALHGVAWTSDASGNQLLAKGTVFPQAIGLASTWDPELIKQVGRATGVEARGYHATNDERMLWGLNMWAPVTNLLRDPRWGRNEEGYSEDPTLTGAIATAYGKGLQGGNPKYLLTAPTLKHYLAYNNDDGPAGSGLDRDTTDSQVPERVLNEYDREAFRPTLAADAATGVMTSYNLVNGRPATVSADLNTVVRSWTKKPLFHVSDAYAPGGLSESQKYYANDTEAFAAVVKSGNDSFTIGNGDNSRTVNAIKNALAQGLLTEADIDPAVRDVLSIRVRLGEFDPDGGPYAKITSSVIGNTAHKKLARQTAADAQVLLKNSGILPLDAAKTKKVAVVGPLAKVLYRDWYSAELPYKVTPVDGIKERLGSSGTVTDSEGADRIALKDVGSGKYVTAGTGDGGALLKATAATAGATEQFDVFDWGQGIVTLRAVANGKFVGRYNWGSNFANDQSEPNGWFVQQIFKLEKQDDGNYLLRYAGYEKAYGWADPSTVYAKVADDGTLQLATKADATKFSKEVVSSGVDEAVKAVTGADTAVVVVGSNPWINGREDHDRTTMVLAEGQEELVKAVRKANPNTIVVVENSYPTTLNWEQANVPAILWTTHAGPETGHALADVLFGDVNPSGRLTQTWYKSDADLPSMFDYDIIKSNRTYLYYQGTPLYPFGYGLSYSTFRYGTPRLSAGQVGAGGTVTVSVDVTNTSKVAGDEVVQLYTHQRTSRDKQPVKQLRTFAKVHLGAGQTKSVQLRLKAADLAHWDVTRGNWVVESSSYDVLIGSSSADIRQRTTLRVNGEKIPARDLSKTTQAITFDDYSGAKLVDESKATGTAVGGATGDWIKFADADLGSGLKGFKARTANADAGDGSVQIRLDGANGPVVGTVSVPSTGDKYTYRDVTAAVTGATGRHDVYLVFSGDLRLCTFSFTK